MPRRAELVTAGLAVAFHVGLGLAVSRIGKPPPTRRPEPVLLQFERRLEPPPVAAAPMARPTSTRQVAVRSRPAVARQAARPATSPARPAPPPAQSPAAAPPVYAVAMTSPRGVASVATVPQGVPGVASRGAGAGAGTGAPGAGEGFRPASAREVGSMPEVDTDACGRAAVYPREAEQSGAEGDVRLRVAITERGQVHAVKVLSGLGHGLDAAAVDALRNRCKFKPAIGRDGQPVAFVIESYVFHFELPR